MQMPVKRWFTFVEETADPAGGAPLRKVAIAAVMANPCVGRYVEDLKPMMEASAALGRALAARAVQAMAPYKVAGLGKGGIVGSAGELELILCGANRGRLNARVGGLRPEDFKGENGLI